MRSFLLFSTFILYAASLAAQDFKGDILKMNKFYGEANSISMKITYRFYADKTSEEVLDEYTGFYKLQGNNIFADVLGVVSVQDEKLKLSVDKTEKYIQVLKPDTLTKKTLSFNDLDKFLKLSKEINYLGENGKNKTYQVNLFPLKSEYDYLKIVISSDDHHLVKLTLYYNKANPLYAQDNKFNSPRVEISYSEVTRDKNIPDSFFDTGKYVTGNSGNYQLTKEYTQYRLFNAYR